MKHLNHSGLEGLLSASEGLRAGDIYSAFMYNAVWTAALAMAQVGIAADGSVDNAALLQAIRQVSFEGATGPVKYDSIGERDFFQTPITIKNARLTGDRRTGALSMVETWRWWPGPQACAGGTGLTGKVREHER